MLKPNRHTRVTSCLGRPRATHVGPSLLTDGTGTVVTVTQIHTGPSVDTRARPALARALGAGPSCAETERM